jgi:hypothetical protein
MKAALLLAGRAPAFAQGFPPLDITDVLGVWDFDDTTGGTQSADLVNGTPMMFVGPAVFSADAGGQSGEAGDFALDFGTTGSTETPSEARVTDTAFFELVNASNSEDQLSVVFWQRWQSETVNNSSTVWFISPSAGGNQRGFQSHVPWGNEQIYFDTSGCCTAGNQRINLANTSFPWQEWHHVALIKNAGDKQIWINGALFHSGTGADPLFTDWTELLLGHPNTEPQNAFRGLIDEIGIFGTALEESHITALVAGTSPIDLALPPEERPPRGCPGRRGRGRGRGAAARPGGRRERRPVARGEARAEPGQQEGPRPADRDGAADRRRAGVDHRGARRRLEPTRATGC